MRILRLALGVLAASVISVSILVAQPSKHILTPIINWATKEIERIEKIQDYSAVMVKRERIDGVLAEEKHLYIKIRHDPFSVYIYFLKPESLRGQEVIWVEGQNDGKMLAHGVGLNKIFGTVHLDPTGSIAMEGSRYPITRIGILNLIRGLKEVAQKDIQYSGCEVYYFQGVKVGERSCGCIQIVHPIQRDNFLFYIARIFIDDEFNVPIRYEAFDWPKKPGEEPELIERYTYTKLKLNNGFTDADFDVNNPQYGFKASRHRRQNILQER